jgi:2-polyprenyl-3-methyl-5-hydroxy-6-metoxy-1,4-benzoquinol methylase
MEKLNSCPVCGSTQLVKELNCNDFVASNETFELQRCGQCTFLFTNPRPKSEEISKYYQSDKYISHAGKKTGFGLMYLIYDVVRNLSIESNLWLIKQYHQNGKLLDLGCGLGYFLHGAIKDKTFESEGADISQDAIDYVHKTFGYLVKNEAELNDIKENAYDIITQWHVLEHVHDLNDRMKLLHKILKPNGTMFIAVPNSNSWDAKFYQSFWDGYDVPRHLYHFNQRSFKLLMQKHGFKIVKTQALLFDAPYISMRSEIHKKANFTMLKGFIYGVFSNLKASQKKDYSSLLFVVKKETV